MRLSEGNFRRQAPLESDDVYFTDFVEDENCVPLLNKLTMTNIFRDIDLINGARPSVHKADFEPGEYRRERKVAKHGK